MAGYPGTTANTAKLWRLAEAHTPAEDTDIYTQAIMDLGATLCKRSRPACESCPLAAQCQAYVAGTQAQYPESKPKKEKPTKEARFFIVRQANGAVLLEQKPLDGLWGGLWTPPERSAQTSPEDFLGELTGIVNGDGATTEAAIENGEIFRHTFTHFHLMIEPIYIQIDHPLNQVNDNTSQLWLTPAEALGGNQPIGLSAPAVKLLSALNTND